MGGEVEHIRLQYDVRRRILDLRSLDVIIGKSDFAHLFIAAKKEEQESVRAWVLSGEKQKVIDWVLLQADVGELSRNKLRELGKLLRIVNYSRLDRSELAKQIEEARCKNEKK